MSDDHLNDGDIERRLSDAFTAQAYSSVADDRVLPPLRLTRPAPPRRHRVLRVLTPLAAAAVVAGVAVGIATNLGNSPAPRQESGGFGASTAPGTTAPGSTTPTGTAPAPNGADAVHVQLAMRDGDQFGVGMPVVAYFSQPVTDGRQLQKLTRVTVNGKPVQAAWYFAPNPGMAGYPVQAHLRMENYWPAHAVITVAAPVAGHSAGGGRVFASDLGVRFETGPETVATVVDAKHELTLMRDGRDMGSFPVSLGATTTPTMKGTKVVMAKGSPLCMRGPGYNECGIKYTQRLTVTGEYLHSAPWNVRNIQAGIDSSNGCTNLTPTAAAELYSMMEVGDIVKYPDATGSEMTFSEGLDDWNVPWTTWLLGGSAPTH